MCEMDLIQNVIASEVEIAFPVNRIGEFGAKRLTIKLSRKLQVAR